MTYDQISSLGDAYRMHNGTLDGKPATIGGYRNKFASVMALDGSCRVEYAWSTLAQCFARGNFSLKS